MRILNKLLLGLIIAWGLLALLLRLAAPLLADYREPLAEHLGQRLGTPVEIGSLEVRWYGISPLVELRAVRIGKGADALALGALSLELNIAGLVRGGWADALRATASGLQLTVLRGPGGQIHLEGLGPIDGGLSGTAGAPPLPGQLHLLDTRVIWIDRAAGRAPLSIERVAARLVRDGEHLELRASLGAADGEAVFAARLKGPLSGTGWRGDTYLKLDRLDAAGLFAAYLPASYGIRSLKLDLESWTQWRDAQPSRSQGHVRLRNVDIRPTVAEQAPLQLAYAGGHFSFEHDPQGLRFALRDLQLALHGQRPWPTGRLAFELRKEADALPRIIAAADYLRIEDVLAILRVRPPWPALATAADPLQPQGELRDLRLSARLDGAALSGWRAHAGFSGLAFEPLQQAPGAVNLSGELSVDTDRLALTLDSRDSELRFHELFRDPLLFERIQGRVDVTRSDRGWRMYSERLLADAPHLRTVSRLRVEQQDGKPLLLDLQTDFRDGDAAFASRYYPSGIMGRELVHWLDHSILSGSVTEGSALLYGPLDSYAFDKTRDGVFQVIFETRDVALDYRSGWPRLDDIAAKVRFHGNQLDIETRSATIYDSRVTRASARIASLEPTAPLQVSGRLEGPLADTLRILGEEALRERFGQFASALQGQGDTELLLDFRIPLDSSDDYALKGRLNFDNARLTLPDWNLTLRRIVGGLDFTLDGLAAKAIRAEALGAPILVDVSAGSGATTRVRSRGRLPLEAIARQLPQLPLGFARGEADFIVDIDLPTGDGEADSPTRLSVSSPLEGVGIDLPEPFGKPSAAPRALHLELPLGGTVDAVGSLGYGDLLSARFNAEGTRVDIELGGGQAGPVPAPGIRIGGQLQQFDAEAWSRALRELPTAVTANTLPPVRLDMRIDRLTLAGQTISGIQLDAAHRDGTWRGALDAPAIAGDFTVPPASADEPVRVGLQRLHIKHVFDSDPSQQTPIPDPGSGPDPAHMPGLALDIADLRFNQARLGRLRLTAEHAAQALQISELSLRDGQLQVDAHGAWSGDNAHYETRLEGTATAPQLGDLLVDLGYSRQLEDADGDFNFDLQWPGHPGQMHTRTLRGDIRLALGGGRLVELDPGVTRIVGLLNLNALTRRLRLDFSDFYKKGYSFDSIAGDLRFGDDAATTENLQVRGPTGRIDVRGSADLAAQSLDQLVTVTPNLDATLPIAGTLAGGPIAGIAVLVAQQVMNQQVEQLNRFEYSLSGPWIEPEVRQLSTGGTLSRLLQGFQPADEAPTPGARPLPPGGQTVPGDPPLRSAPAQYPSTPAIPQQTTAEAVETSATNPLRTLINVLKRGKPHGADLPGTSN